MPKFSANLSMLFTELPFLDRFAAAAASGFTGVEFMFPYAFDANDIAQQLSRHNLTLVLFNLPPGHWDSGDRGRAIFPDAVDVFRDGVREALRYASILECRNLHCLAGVLPTSSDRQSAHRTYVQNLRYAADRAAQDGVTVLIEPINTIDIPNYFLTSSAQARAVITEVGANNVAMQYDLYHMHMMGEDLVAELSANQNLIRHIQIADAPGRHEPGSGTINFPALFSQIDTLGYDGWIGLEYRPMTTTAQSLQWLGTVAT